jgi:hypothetical protein
VPLRRPGPAALVTSGAGLAALLLVAAVGLVLAANAVPAATPPATPAAAEPYSARWVCPLYQGQTGAVTVANVGRGAATLRTTMWSGDKPAPPANKTLAAGATLALPVKASKPGYVQVEAFSAPIVLTNGDGPGCAPGPSDRWWLPAGDNTPGTTTTVVLANPDSDPAVHRLHRRPQAVDRGGRQGGQGGGRRGRQRQERHQAGAAARPADAALRLDVRRRPDRRR